MEINYYLKLLTGTNGTYEVSSIKYNKIDEKDINEFSEHFAGCLHNIFDKHGQWPDIPEQLAYAYLECNKKYLSSPCSINIRFYRYFRFSTG